MNAQQAINPMDDKTTALTLVNQTDDISIELPIELRNTTGTNLKQLIDDCLLEIFSVHSLTLNDLCSLAETCQRFQPIIQQVFPKKFEIAVCADNVYKFISDNYEERTNNGSDIAQIVKNFGSRLSKLSMSRNDPVVVDSVAKYCGAGTFKRLVICDVDVAETFKPIFQQLQALRINRARIECSNPFAICHSLTELDIHSTLNYEAILQNTFPKLERFSFTAARNIEENYGSPSDADPFLKFIARHNYVKTLMLDADFVYRSPDFAHTIGNNCRDLEELTLRKFYGSKVQFDFSQLETRTTLRMLNVDIGYVNYRGLMSLLQALKTLEVVRLSHVKLNPLVYDDVLPPLSQLQNLRELRLLNCATSYHFAIPWTMLIGLVKLRLINFCGEFSIVEIIDQLENLEELIVFNIKTASSYNLALSEEMFSEIVKIVDRRSHVVTIRCRCEFNETFSENYCEKIQNVKLINLSLK